MLCMSWQYSINSLHSRFIGSFLTLPDWGSKNLNSNLRMVDFPVKNVQIWNMSDIHMYYKAENVHKPENTTENHI